MVAEGHEWTSTSTPFVLPAHFQSFEKHGRVRCGRDGSTGGAGLGFVSKLRGPQCLKLPLQ